MSAPLHQNASSIAHSIDNSRTVAKACVTLSYLLRRLARSDEVTSSDPNVPSLVTSVIADLGMALGEASVFPRIEHWITSPRPIKFAEVQAGSVHRVALEIASCTHRAAAHAIEVVHDEEITKRRQQSSEWEERLEDDGSPNGVLIRTRQCAPFVIICQTDSTELIRAWHLETWDAVRDALSQQPLFNEQRLLAMIDCEYGVAKRRIARWSEEKNRSRGENKAWGRISSAEKVLPEPAVHLNANWRDPVRVRGKIKSFQNYTQFKVIKALKEAGSNGLTKDELEAVATNARKILSFLQKDEDWAAVVQMAEKRGNRYRLLDF